MNIFQKYGRLFLLAAGAGAIFQIPYIRETFYIPTRDAMDLTNAQMGWLSGGYSIVATVSYFFGGVLADKISPRKVLSYSFLSTGILGLWLSTFPNFLIALLIYCLMGISTIITWSATVKATRLLGNSDEQGKLFGWQEGLRGIATASLVFLMTYVYSLFSNEILGTSWAIRICAIVVIIIGVLNFIFLKETSTSAESEPISKVLKGLFKVLLIPKVWLLIAMVFFAYSLYGIIGYINTFAISVYKLSVEGGSTLGGARYLVQAAGGILGGIIADRLHSRTKVIFISSLALTLSFVLFLTLPSNYVLLWIVISNFIFALFFIYVIRSQYFAIIDDLGFSQSLTGRVSGVVSCFGYMPDMFMFTMIGSWLDRFSGKDGFNLMFIYAIVMCIGCVLISYILHRMTKINF
ncbi:MFS transporter [Staphylococcus pseudoxylosus]|uniref:MFS transporter n=1 Tax=Staphylococcus pseudoxylosus TaxID=2282419 RepID=UPI002DBDF126|nr:MFS transporter [Staphylococcus pseudoxylosus]MEB7754896.1 MFS transporter [Staphylococcus pseudoxylosus]